MPVYKDNVVRIQGKAILYVSLHPKLDSFAIKDAILNGMEVYKLSNSDGNLAVAGRDPESVPSALPAQQPTSTASESKTKKTIIVATIESGAGFLVVLTLVWF